MGLFDFFKNKRIGETVNQPIKIEETAKQTTQFDEKKESKMPPVIKENISDGLAGNNIDKITDQSELKDIIMSCLEKKKGLRTLYDYMLKKFHMKVIFFRMQITHKFENCLMM